MLRSKKEMSEVHGWICPLWVLEVFRIILVTIFLGLFIFLERRKHE
jgi:hypothetical protein